MTVQAVSKTTLQNWWIDALLFGSAVLASITGIYFLYFPSNGYMGGRNPYHDFTLIFNRSTWDLVHTWTGAAMIAVVMVHLVIHWKWVVSMIRRSWNELTGKCGCMNARGRWNLILNAVVAVSFLLTALSGVYFMFVSGSRWAADPMILFSRYTWDMLHTWSGVVMIIAAVLHFAIHWRWVVNVTRKIANLRKEKNSPMVTKPLTTN